MTVIYGFLQLLSGWRESLCFGQRKEAASEKLMFSLRCLRAKKVLKLRTENLDVLDGVFKLWLSSLC